MQSPSPTATTRLRAAQRLLMLLVAIVAAILVGTTTVAAASPAFKPSSPSGAGTVSVLETRVGVADSTVQPRVGPGRSVVAGQVGVSCPRFVQMVVGSCVATKPGAAGAADDLAALSASQRKAVDSLGKRAAEHQAKLDAYRADPDAFDNQGLLRNAPSDAVRQRIIDGRIRHLENEIKTFQDQIRKITGGK